MRLCPGGGPVDHRLARIPVSRSLRNMLREPGQNQIAKLQELGRVSASGKLLGKTQRGFPVQIRKLLSQSEEHLERLETTLLKDLQGPARTSICELRHQRRKMS